MNTDQIALAYAAKVQQKNESALLLRAAVELGCKDAAGGWSTSALKRFGQLLSDRLPLELQENLSALEASMNSHLVSNTLGWVRLSDQADSLSIMHFGFPSELLMEDEKGEFWPFILIGLYEAWFKSVGAPDDLSVTQCGDALPETQSVTLSLAK